MSPTRFIGGLAAALFVFAFAQTANAFCGFYVAKADTDLFNKSSKVVLARDKNRTVITMVNDYQGDPREFAMVVPVPYVLNRNQIHVTENAIVEHLDAYTAPRLVEYFDDDPCLYRYRLESAQMSDTTAAKTPMPSESALARALGVTIEAEYTVGEYDILILSAEQSDGLQTWLETNDYKVPARAKEVLAHYLANGMKFFVARVNLSEKTKAGFTYLRPLQLAFESDHFMLPIRLGMVNAQGSQDLFIFTLTRDGRVETENYRTVRIPTGQEIPLHVRDDFGRFYDAMFTRSVERENGRAVFLEYAWDMAWCDPCAADPLTREELEELGVHWLVDTNAAIAPPGPPRGQDVFVTRLHVRYDETTFPDDLMLKMTGDRTNIQGRYVLRHPWKGEAQCPEANRYFASLGPRFEEEAKNLANLTGWNINEIRDDMARNGQRASAFPYTPVPPGPWWIEVWPDKG